MTFLLTRDQNHSPTHLKKPANFYQINGRSLSLGTLPFARKDYYELLELSPSATLDDIKSSYRSLALKYHPDRSSDTVRFLLVKEAYEVLSDADKRQRFNDYIGHHPPPVVKQTHHSGEVRERIQQRIQRQRYEQAMENERIAKERAEEEKAKEAMRERQRQEERMRWEKIRGLEQEVKHSQQAPKVIKSVISKAYIERPFEMEQMRYTPLSPTQVEQSSKIIVESKAVEVKEESKITLVEYDSKKIVEVLGGAQKEDRGSNGPVYLIAVAIGLLIYYAKTPKEHQENITPLPKPKFYETKEFKMLEKASQAEPEKAQSPQQKKDYSQMKTIVLIPFEPTAPDPDWLYKYYEGAKLIPEENDLLQQHLFDLQHQRVIKNFKHDLWKGIPSRDKVVSILLKAKDLKDRYNIQSQFLCHPARYNARLFQNPFLESKGGLHTSSNPNPSLVFAHWNQEVKEDLPIIKMLMKHYDIPVHGTFFLDNADAVNAVYQAKYGLFTCGETHLYVGQGDFNTLLINIWENQQEKQRKMWYLAIASGLKEGMIKFSDIEEFRIRHPKGLSEKRLKQSKERVQMERQLNLINR